MISEGVIIKDNSITNSNGDGGIKIGELSLNTVVIDIILLLEVDLVISLMTMEMVQSSLVISLARCEVKIFVNNFSGANAVFSGRDKRRNMKTLEQQI